MQIGINFDYIFCSPVLQVNEFARFDDISKTRINFTKHISVYASFQRFQIDKKSFSFPQIENFNRGRKNVNDIKNAGDIRGQNIKNVDVWCP